MTYVLDREIEHNLKNPYYSNLHRYQKAQLVPRFWGNCPQNSSKSPSIKKYGHVPLSLMVIFRIKLNAEAVFNEFTLKSSGF